MSDPIVIIGAGQAAASFISRHIALGNQQPLLLIGDEPLPPYQRPPLSKKYLLGELDRERLFIRPQQWYADRGVTTRFNTRVDSIAPGDKNITTENGETIAYSQLVLCTGSRARDLPDAIGGHLENVFTLRNMADIDEMSPEFKPGRKLLIIGGGYIGLEAAAVARLLGLEVVLLEMADRVLQRVAAEQTSDYFRKLHLSHGVDLRESARLSRLIKIDGRVTGAELDDGETIDADSVLVGIGSIPNSELAEAAGLDCDNGISVNQTCQTSDANIYAAGDCCSFIREGSRIRLESVQNASDQGDLIARVFAGEDVRYKSLPWFWSDQYGCKLQIAGLNHGFDQTMVRPGANEDSQSIWYYREGNLIAVDAMNDPKAYAFGRKIIDAGLNPAPEVVADPGTDLKALAKN
ncbi:MAG: FAD-dependent oxidoreductase [Gammaproteobacteria bacterium]|nr:FAD-dependent oxidoreductase [Gammaproteobacteria bacterium]